MKLINIIEDAFPLLNAMANFLTIAGYKVRKFSHVNTFLQEVSPYEESVALISFSVSAGRGLWLLKEMRERSWRTAVVMISEGEETSRIVEAMKLGAIDVLEKPFLMDKLVSVVAEASDGERRAAEIMFSDGLGAWKPQLTDEEDSILELLSQGCTVKEIAAKLDISIRTIHYRKHTIFEKIGVKNRTEAMTWVAQSRPVRAVHFQAS